MNSKRSQFTSRTLKIPHLFSKNATKYQPDSMFINHAAYLPHFYQYLSNLSIHLPMGDIVERLLRGGALLDFQNMEAAIKNAADSVRKMPAVRKGSNVNYAIVVKFGYEEIKKLREEGYGYDIICKMFSENGLLCANANHKTFCTAFLRETRRRMPQADGRHPTMGTGNAPEKKTEANPLTARTSAVVPTHRTAGSSMGLEVKSANTPNTKPIAPDAISDSKEEWLKRMSGKKVDTGLGIITKYTDGSFDYD